MRFARNKKTMDENMFLSTNPGNLEIIKKIQKNNPELVRQQKMLVRKKYRHEQLYRILYGLLPTSGMFLAAAEGVVFSMNLLPVECLVGGGSLGIFLLFFSRYVIEKQNRNFWNRMMYQDMDLYTKLGKILDEERKNAQSDI